MTKLEELKAALESATPGEWDYFIASNADRPNSQVLDSNDDNLLTHSKGITGRAQSDVELITLSHNLMPTLVQCFDNGGRTQVTKDHKFMGLAYARAQFSKDTSTKVGAIIVGPAGEDRASGYNGAPRGCRADELGDPPGHRTA